MKIRNATQEDLPFIATANAALATETEGQTLDPGWRNGLFLWIQSVYVLPVYRGPESHEEM